MTKITIYKTDTVPKMKKIMRGMIKINIQLNSAEASWIYNHGYVITSAWSNCFEPVSPIRNWEPEPALLPESLKTFYKNF